jgi:hypothetical protein
LGRCVVAPFEIPQIPIYVCFVFMFVFFEYVGPKFMLCLVRETSCSCSVLDEGSLGQVEGLVVLVLQCFLDRD